ncbi:MAG: thiamine diphosphokinase [Oscillospiraceae bacterium]|nr:thiamine diphosphokinase [Oscillospiraceae bacterium]
MERKECYIIGAGDFFSLRSRPCKDDYVIAADGGYRHCLAEKLKVDLLLGDFDSLGEVPDFDSVEQVPVEKDDTDTMLALKKGLAMGYRSFRIYGGTGGRLDHTLANLQALLYLAKRGAIGWLYDKNFVYSAICNETVTLTGEKDAVFSVFAMDGPARGITIRGAKYSLEDAELRPDFPLGVSNHFLDGEVEITVKDGALIIGAEMKENEE